MRMFLFLFPVPECMQLLISLESWLMMRMTPE